MKATHEEWLATFKPVKNHLDPDASIDGLMFETYGEEMKAVEAADPSCVWTVLDCDGKTVISSGFHHVNRLGYIICEVPLPDSLMVDVEDDNEVKPETADEVLVVRLANGDSALYLNRQFLMDLDGNENAPTMPEAVGEALANALGLELHTTNLEVPSDPEWSWNDVMRQLPSFKAARRESIVPVAYWNSTEYGCEEDAPKDFLMSITDQRESNGQMYVDIASKEGDLDDILSLTIEINRLPESKTDTQCVHLHFDNDNMCCSIFKQGDRYIVRPETDVTIRDTRLPTGEAAWILE